MNNSTTTTAAAAPRLETETCGRCGGSGSHSYCQRYGSVCFGCGGSGVQYTKRGKLAATYLNEFLSKPASALKVGDKIRGFGITAGGDAVGQWEIVTEQPVQETAESNTGWGESNGVRTYYFRVVTNKCTHGTSADTIFRVAADKETKRAAMEKAIAFQDSLTKAGKPRK